MAYVSIQKRGVAALETAIAVSIAALVLIGATQAIVQFVNAGVSNAEQTIALSLAQDGIELARFLRDDNWSTIGSLSVNTSYRFSISGSSVSLASGTETIDGFTRTLTVANVFRDTTTHDIVPSTQGGAVADPDSRYVTITVNGASLGAPVTLTTILADLDP